MLFDVSVIIPVYNAEKFVEKAVKSALQFEAVKEIILIEDGSDDGSLQICTLLQNTNQRIKLYKHAGGKNRGAGASRNIGLKNASCNYVAFLDADDYYLPDRFDSEFKLFKQYADADGIYGAIGVEFADSVSLQTFMNKYFIKNEAAAYAYLTTFNDQINPSDLFDSLSGFRKYKGEFHLDGLTVKKSVIEKFHLFFNEKLRLHQDTEFKIRLSYFANLYPGNIATPVAIRGVHSENRITKVSNYTYRFYKNRARLFKELHRWAKNQKLPTQYVNLFSHKYRVCFIKSIIPFFNKKSQILGV
jgi:glycosyltransferase involved in cell wall biosynthesis